MVFFFGRRIQTSAYMRNSLVAAAKAEELRNLKRELDERALAGPLDNENPPPPGFEWNRRALWGGEQHRVSQAEDTEFRPGANGEDDQAATQRIERIRTRQEDEARRLAEFERWARTEQQRYEVTLQKLEARAQGIAESRVPISMDISLLGGGWSFLLEFSTVIVILFILLCLGILSAVTGKDATTILASIAGYVLGKASASIQRSPQAGGSPSGGG
jgi:hypothetical protein